MYIIRNFLVLHFVGNFMKIQTKIAKLQVHENLYKNVNENMFSFTLLDKVSWVFVKGNKSNRCLTLLISYMVFNPFKLSVQFF